MKGHKYKKYILPIDLQFQRDGRMTRHGTISGYGTGNGSLWKSRGMLDNKSKLTTILYLVVLLLLIALLLFACVSEIALDIYRTISGYSVEGEDSEDAYYDMEEIVEENAEEN